MSDEDAFSFEFELPQAAMSPDAAAEWLEAFAKQLAKKDTLLVEITGEYHLDEPDGPQPHAAEAKAAEPKAAEGGDAQAHVLHRHPVVNILICPGKRPYKGGT